MANENDQEIKITFDTNAKDAAKDSNTLGKSLDTVEKKTGTLSKSNAELSKTQKDAKKSGDEQKAGFEDLGSGIGDTIGQVKRLGKQFLALLANPIILFLAAIVAALALLFKAFTSTNDGADKMERVMAAVGATIDVLRDRFLKLWNALTSFDFEGIKASFSGITDEIEKEAAKAAELAGALQEVEDATRSLGVSRAKLNRDLAESKELITDETASYADKKKAIEAVKNAEGAQTAQELANAKKKYNAIRDQNALSDSSDEALQKEADALSAVYALEQKSADDRRSIRKTELRADNEENARLKAITDEKKARYKEASEAKKAQNDKDLANQKEHDAQMASLLKEKLDAEQNLLRFNQDLNDKTDEEKLARQKERDLAEIELLKKKGIDVAGILALNAEKYDTLERELYKKRISEAAKRYNDDLEQIIANKEIDDETRLEAIATEQELLQAQYDAKILTEEEFNAKQQFLSDARKQMADEELAKVQAVEQAKTEAIRAGITDVENIGQQLQVLAGKNKAMMRAGLIIEGAVGLAKIISNTMQAVSKTQASFPGPIGIGLSIANIASGALSAAAQIKAVSTGLKAVGGGSAGGDASAVTSAAPPSVAFNNTAENQIGQSVARTQGDLPPLKVYVAESDISKAQNNVKVLVNKNTF